MRQRHGGSSCRENLQIPPLTREEAERIHSQAPQWELLDDAHRIERSFRFRNFREALNFVESVSELAEAQGHHPDINFGWGYATVSLRTKKIARERFHHGCEDRWHLRARGKGLSSRFLAAPLASFPSWRGLARNSAVHRLLPHLGRAIFSQSTAGAGGSPLDSERFRSIPRT
jgi:pterin-4a-carbinolamine dehydratase